MQCPTIMSFRKRLSNRGYSYISIKRIRCYHFNNSGTYKVCAIEPLSKSLVSCDLSVIDMDKLFR